MIRVAYVAPQTGEQQVTLEHDAIRLGTGQSCEVRIDSRGDARIGEVHAELVREEQQYVLRERLMLYGVWLNGERVKRAQIRSGDSIRLGAKDGPEVRVLEAPRAVRTTPARPASSPKIEPARAPAAPAPRQDVPSAAPATGAEVQHWLARVMQDLSAARAKAPGGRSGQTAVIMAKALAGIRQTEQVRTRMWRRVLVGVLGASVVTVLVMGSVIFLQQRKINQLVSEKSAIDAQIQTVFADMAKETDEGRLKELETKLQSLMGNAAEKIAQVSRANESKAEELAEPADPLEKDIRRILRSFGADTYAIPPIFKDALREKVEQLRANPNLPNAKARRNRYWPVIHRALTEKQLPSELGYIAYAESAFDPNAVNAKSGASGLWQLMPEVARGCGIVVAPPADERFEPAKASEAAACYLSKLLIEFGQESFMLALASYNRGENGVRRALHKVANEPGGYKKRDFWHLYRLKLLPEETREYVPKVLAAAIVLDPTIRR